MKYLITVLCVKETSPLDAKEASPPGVSFKYTQNICLIGKIIMGGRGANLEMLCPKHHPI